MLETRIEELTAAVKALTEALSKTQAPNPVTAPLDEIKIYPNALADGQTKKSAGKSAVTEKASSSTAAATESEIPNDPPSSSDTTSGGQSQPTGESSSPELTYNDHVKPATLKLSQKMGREVAIAVLGRFGVKGAQNLDASQWADYIAHCESVMNGGEV